MSFFLCGYSFCNCKLRFSGSVHRKVCRFYRSQQNRRLSGEIKGAQEAGEWKIKYEEPIWTVITIKHSPHPEHWPPVWSFPPDLWVANSSLWNSEIPLCSPQKSFWQLWKEQGMSINGISVLMPLVNTMQCVQSCANPVSLRIMSLNVTFTLYLFRWSLVI